MAEPTRIVTVGIQGPQGVQGPQGPVGPAGVDVNYVHHQTVPATEWVVDHQKGRVMDLAYCCDENNTVEYVPGEDQEITLPFRLTLYFQEPKTGWAFLV